jgi:hypothetical protein
MTTKAELAERLLRRFKGVPNFLLTDAEELVDDAMQVHGFASSSIVPESDVNLILLYAQAEGAWQIALATAHYFSYQDGEESVDKSNVSEQYRKLAQDIRGQYEVEKARKSGSSFFIMKRIDRP